MLPLVYVALLAALAGGVILYAVAGLAMVASAPGMLSLMLYIGPLVVGSVVVVFLVKPLFTRRPTRGRPVSLSPADEPTVIAFAERLADAVGAPRPSRVDVDCRPNASASFRRGVLSMVGTDLVLTIGLPLADALTVRQLAGVLAHEYGHFAQGSGMRLTYIVERVSEWFARVAFERSALDDQLRERAEAAGGWTSLVLIMSLAGVALSRNLLGALMRVGQRLSRRLLRQMEFDADRYEVRVVGVEAFRSTSEQMLTLAVAEQHAHADLSIRVRDRRLPDDWPAVLALVRTELPDEVVQAVLADARNASTGPYDTHPSLSERLASAEREGGDGLPLPDAAARTLFADFEGVSRRATLAFYEAGLDAGLDSVDVVSTSETLGERAAEIASSAALARVSTGVARLPSAARVQAAEDPDPAARLPTLRDRQLALALAPSARAAVATMDEVARDRALAVQAAALTGSMVRFKAQEFGVSRCSVEAANERLAELEHAERDALEALRPFHEVLQTRIETALGLARQMEPPPPELEGLGRQLAAARALDAECDALRDLEGNLASLAVLVEVAMQGQHENQVDEYLGRRILGQVAGARAGLYTLRAQLEGCPYPFRHRTHGLSLGHYVVEEVPGRKEVRGVLERLDDALNRVAEVNVRVWSTLAVIVEHVEARHGQDTS